MKRAHGDWILSIFEEVETFENLTGRYDGLWQCVGWRRYGKNPRFSGAIFRE
jgi:hypothetical protein